MKADFFSFLESIASTSNDPLEMELFATIFHHKELIHPIFDPSSTPFLPLLVFTNDEPIFIYTNPLFEEEEFLFCELPDVFYFVHERLTKGEKIYLYHEDYFEEERILPLLREAVLSKNQENFHFYQTLLKKSNEKE